jgi:hypothetical protein
MKTEQFENIKKHLYLAGKLHEIATFQCYYDGLAVFHIWMVNGVTELCFICDEMHFLDTEKVIDIIDREDLIYLSHAEFNKESELLFRSEDYLNPDYKEELDDDEDI